MRVMSSTDTLGYHQTPRHGLLWLLICAVLCYAEMDSVLHLKSYLNSLDSFCDDISMMHGNQWNIDACHFTKLSGPDT